jgi:hypothetical protein
MLPTFTLKPSALPRVRRSRRSRPPRDSHAREPASSEEDSLCEDRASSSGQHRSLSRRVRKLASGASTGVRRVLRLSSGPPMSTPAPSPPPSAPPAVTDFRSSLLSPRSSASPISRISSDDELPRTPSPLSPDSAARPFSGRGRKGRYLDDLRVWVRLNRSSVSVRSPPPLSPDPVVHTVPKPFIGRGDPRRYGRVPPTMSSAVDAASMVLDPTSQVIEYVRRCFLVSPLNPADAVCAQLEDRYGPAPERRQRLPMWFRKPVPQA